MKQGVVCREGRVACIGVFLTDQEGSQHLRAGAAREQEDDISEALFYRGWTAASTPTFNACDPKLSLVKRLRYFARKVDAVVDFSELQCAINSSKIHTLFQGTDC